MQRNWARFLLKTALGLGLSATMTSMALAQYQPGTYSPYMIAQGTPSRTPSTPQTPPGGDNVPRPADQGATTPQNIDTSSSPSGDTGEAPGGTGETTGMVGRLDSNNRFNLFDTQSAIPMNRVWFGFQYASGFTTGFTDILATHTDTTATGFRHNPIELAYRLGAEYAFSSCFSIAVEGQYSMQTDLSGLNQPAPGFNNPQLMAKYVVLSDDCNVLSATFGINIDIDPGKRQIAENNWRFLPGLLAYHKMDKAFVQAGTQFGLPTDHEGYTWDNALSVGYWLVGGEGNADNCDRLISGIAPQLEIYSKYVMADRTVRGGFFLPFDTQITEPRWVFDLTAGVTVFIKDRIWVANGISFPLTGPDVRNFEYLTTIGFKF